jgi:hypothetical protein
MSLLARNVARKKVRTSGPNWRYLSDAFVSYTTGGDITVADEAYGVGWNASLEVPTKNAIYDKIEAIPAITDGDKGDVAVSSSGTVWTVESLAGGANTLSRAGTALTLTNTTNSALVEAAAFHGDRATVATNDEAYTGHYLSDDAGNQDEMVRQSWYATSVTSGAETARQYFWTRASGTLARRWYFDHINLVPFTNDGLALGSASLGWSDLHLATGGTINWANSDATITHASNFMTFQGASWYFVANEAAGTSPLWTRNTTDSSSVMAMRIEGDRATPTANDSVYCSFYLSDVVGTQTEFGRITVQAADITDASEDGAFLLGVPVNGSFTNKLYMNASTLAPSTSDGLALGTTVLMWADAYFASGAQLNFNNGDVTLTHVSNTLSGAGGQLAWEYNGAATTAPVRVINNTDNANVEALRVEGDRATPTSGDIVYIAYYASDSVGNQEEMARVACVISDITNASEDSYLLTYARTNGTLSTATRMTTTAFSPHVSDAMTLGTTANMWGDLFGASGFTLNLNNGDVVLTHSTGVLNVSTGALQQGGVAVNVAGKQSIPVPAAAMTTRTTAGAAAGTTETATNRIMLITLDYDASTAEHGQFTIPAMPKSWNESTITMRFIWTATNTGNVVWGVQAVALSDDDVADTAFGTAVTVTDGVTAANDIMKSAETTAVTIGGTPAEGDMVVFQVYRDAANGSDTCTVDAKLIGVELFITTNAANDA